jgi:CheY-like chemotaxis protein
MADKGRILIVEDDQAIAWMYKLKLEQEGWRVEIAADGEEGLASLLADPPSVLLLDIMLPGIDGFEALERLRADPATRSITVVLLSNSQPTPSTLDRARSLGALEWLVKSRTTPGVLTEELDRLLGHT